MSDLDNYILLKTLKVCQNAFEMGLFFLKFENILVAEDLPTLSDSH